MGLTISQIDSAILQYIRRYSRADEFPEKDFQALAFKIFSHQYQNNPLYRRFCDLEGKNPSRVNCWKEIPAMPAEGFKEMVMTSFPHRRSVRVFRTSGTSRGARGSHYFETLKLYDAAIKAPFKKFLLPDRARMDLYFLTASPAELKDSSLSYMMGFVRKNFGYPGKNPFYVRGQRVLSAKLAYDLALAKKPVMILATAFSLKSFLDFLAAQNIRLRLKPGSRLMETGGFKGRVREVSKKELYRQCRERLGIPENHCVSEYGMTELSSQYYDTTLSDKIKKLRRPHFKSGPAWMRAVVVDIKTGREAKIGGRGILRHFDLANRGSVLAVQTQDIAVRHKEGFEVLGRAPHAETRGCSLTYEAFLKGKS